VFQGSRNAQAAEVRNGSMPLIKSPIGRGFDPPLSSTRYHGRSVDDRQAAHATNFWHSERLGDVGCWQLTADATRG
jgi:hypothetical protein